MTSETRESGKCAKCGEPVTLVRNSNHPTCRADGNRYIDASEPDKGWCLFRCRKCRSVIEDNWTGLHAPCACKVIRL